VRYCLVMQAQGFMCKIEKVYVDELPTEQDIEWWEDHQGMYNGNKWVVTNVFQVSDGG